MLIDPTTHNDCGGYNHYNWSKNQGLICSSLVAWLLIFFHTRTATDAAQLAALVQMEVKCLVQGYLNDVIRVRCCALTWVVAASLILTSYWSSGTAHAEFSWLKLTERNQWMGCCTEEKKEPNCSCEAGVSFCHYCSFSSLFSFTLQALHSFFFCTQPSLLNELEFSSALRLMDVEIHSPNSLLLLLSTYFHRWVQMDTKPQTGQYWNFFFLWLSEQVFNFPPAKFITAIKRVVYLLVKQTCTVSTCIIQRCVKESFL